MGDPTDCGSRDPLIRQLDWEAFFGALNETGCEDFCSVEYESFDYYARVLNGDPEAAARMSFEQVQALSERL